MAHDAVTVCVTFLKLLCNNARFIFLTCNLHYRIVQLGIKLAADCLDWLYFKLFKLRDKLLINHVHALGKRFLHFLLGKSCKPPLKVIYHRKDFFNNAFCSGFKHCRFFLFGALAEIIELCHLTLYAIFQFIYFFLKLVRLFFFSQQRFFLSFFFIRICILRRILLCCVSLLRTFFLQIFVFGNSFL